MFNHPFIFLVIYRKTKKKNLTSLLFIFQLLVIENFKNQFHFQTFDY
jgi:hypothetical protein